MESMTGIPLFDRISEVLGALYVIGSFILVLLPRNSRYAKILAQVLFDLKKVRKPEDEVKLQMRPEVEAEVRASMRPGGEP